MGELIKMMARDKMKEKTIGRRGRNEVKLKEEQWKKKAALMKYRKIQ
jgi:hypothetical protein